ncbi:MAG: Flp family type IVb pilin [Candidatus Eremiobacteraeota bacterium]|nr:Flp family type IVb pilin [Candidatus Eremiobacteraeota bacterium]
MFKRFRRLAGDDDGATLVEYSLVVMLIAAVAIVVLTAIGKDVAGIFTGILPALQPPS